MIQIAQPFQNFVDTSGQPLDNGYVYIGTADQNPETNAIAVYWDASLTIPAAQPIRTINGYLSRNGSPARLYADASRYSITVRDRNSAIVITAIDASTLDNLRADLAASTGSSLVGHIAEGTGVAPETVQTVLRRLHVTPFSYSGVGNGVVDDTSAVLAAAVRANTISGVLDLLNGTWLCSNLDLSAYTNIAAIIGQGVGTLKTKTGTTGTFVKWTGIAGKTISDVVIECDDVAGLTVGLDTSWPTVGPSLYNTYRKVIVQNYTGTGWLATHNNDCAFDECLVRQPNGAAPVAFSINASGGLVHMKDCIWSDAICDIASQNFVLTGCWGHGIRLSRLQSADNVGVINGGYIYGNADTGSCISVYSPATAGQWTRGLTLNGTLLTPTANGQNLFEIGLVGCINLNSVIDETSFTHTFFSPSTVNKAASGTCKVEFNGLSVVGIAPAFNAISGIQYINRMLDLNGVVTNDFAEGSYTPAWTTTGVAPSLGNGTLVGHYVKNGKHVIATITLTMGSTTTFGTGNYRLSLPVQSLGGLVQTGPVTMTDSGTGYFTGMASLFAANTVFEIFLNGAATPVTNTTPMTWASGDVLVATINYIAS